MKKGLIFLVSILLFQYDGPDGDRTHDLCVANAALIPAELQAHAGSWVNQPMNSKKLVSLVQTRRNCPSCATHS